VTDRAHTPLRIAVLMPARNEGDSLGPTLETLRAAAPSAGEIALFVVDDGSDDPVQLDALPGPTAAFHVTLARHVANLGQGAALETARQLALRSTAGFDAYVTMDADGQHTASDAIELARAIAGGADVAFGNRFQGDSNVPAARRVLLLGAGWFERALTGLRLADAHNGLRAFSRRAIEQISIHQNRMAHATEIKQRVAGAVSLAVVEVPVSVRYSRRTLGRGQSGLGAVVILTDLILQYLFREES
jgi:polyprenyl-phospho-N-acetylgalactosaminyl synthase